MKRKYQLKFAYSIRKVFCGTAFLQIKGLEIRDYLTQGTYGSNGTTLP
jgi:hypothetical protein